MTHKDHYSKLIGEYPAYSDISFSTLQIWWNLSDQLQVSTLNKNIIIHYLLPFDEENSGYSIVGQYELDESIQSIFDYQVANNLPARLVHVPEFAISNIKNKQNLKITEELDYNEYLLDSKLLATLEGHDLGRIRRKVARFLRETEGIEVKIESMDLSVAKNTETLMESIVSWEEAREARNDPDHTEHDAIRKTLGYASDLDTRNLCIYLDSELHGIILYDLSFDGKSYIIHHLKVNYSTPFIFDYATQVIAEHATKDEIPLINMEMDLGIENLRYHKMNLKPVDFYRKYTVEPHDSNSK